MKNINGIIKIIIMAIIAFLIGIVIEPIIDILSGVIAFGMGLGIAYLVVCWAEDKWKWFR